MASGQIVAQDYSGSDKHQNVTSHLWLFTAKKTQLRYDMDSGGEASALGSDVGKKDEKKKKKKGTRIGRSIYKHFGGDKLWIFSCPSV